MPDEKKLYVDEDWKSQVQAEKEAYAKRGQAAGAGASGDPAPAARGAASAGSAAGPEGDPPLPPASFEMLVSTLATEAMMAMGHIPHPLTGRPELRRNQAKYLIDTIEVLQEKTKGNLSADEALAVEDLLHQLRMAYVASAPPQAGSR